jgi:hypothetical protein
VPAIMECVQRNQSDLLAPGLHRHSLLFRRLWNHTTPDLVQQLSGSILGVPLKRKAAPPFGRWFDSVVRAAEAKFHFALQRRFEIPQ